MTSLTPHNRQYILDDSGSDHSLGGQADLANDPG